MLLFCDFNIPSESSDLSEIELEAKDLLKASESERVLLDADDVFESRSHKLDDPVKE